MKKLFSALKFKIPVYRRNQQLIRELSISKKGYYPPGHYYSPIVSKDFFPDNYSVDYNKPLAGIDLNDNNDMALLNLLKLEYTDSLFPMNKKSDHRYYFEIYYFSFSDEIFLSLIMRHYKPSRIIEVGSGFSSAVMLDTNEKYLSNRSTFTFIEPFPEERLDRLLRENETCIVKKN